MEGRARVERDHDRGASLPAPLPGAPRPRDRPVARERAARATAHGRDLVDLVRGPGGSVRHGRGVRRVEARRRRRRRRHARVHPRRRRRPAHAHLHAGVPRPDRAMAVAAARARAGRDDPASRRRAVLGLRLLVLGATDVGVAVGRGGAPAGPSEPDRPQRDRWPQDGTGGHAAAVEVQATRDRRRGTLGARAAGGRRIVGRHPATVGLVARDARRRSDTGSRTMRSRAASPAGRDS